MINLKRPWTSEEDQQLRQRGESGKSFTSIMARLKRTEMALRQRLQVLKIGLRESRPLQAATLDRAVVVEWP
jgi:hypothetical protein